MGVGLALVVGAVVAVAFVYGRRLWSMLTTYRRWKKELGGFPSPPTLPGLGNVHLFPQDRIAFAYAIEDIMRAHSRDGMMCLWFGPIPAVLAFSPDAVEALLSNSDNITKSDIGYIYLRRWLGDGLLLSTGPKWRGRRKMLTPTFHYGILQGFCDIQARQAGILAEELLGHAKAESSFDLFPYVGRCALDIICESAMGVDVKAQKELESPYVQAVIQMTEDSFVRDRLPWFWSDTLYDLFGQGKRWRSNLAMTAGFTRKVIKDRKASLAAQAAAKGIPLKDLKLETKRQAFLDLLILMQAEKGELSDEDIKDEVDVFMFEGHDTTSSGISWALYLLGLNPAVQDRVAQELVDVFGPDDDLRPATADDLKEMKYLERVVKESQRLFPSVPVYGRKVTSAFQMGGHTIPEGVNCAISPFFLHRSERAFGADWETFDPDRFLPERSVDRHPFAYVPFSAGPRNCIGQRFAMMEEKAVISRVLRQFRITSLASLDQVHPIPDLILRPPKDLPVKVSLRR